MSFPQLRPEFVQFANNRHSPEPRGSVSLPCYSPNVSEVCGLPRSRPVVCTYRAFRVPLLSIFVHIDDKGPVTLTKRLRVSGQSRMSKPGTRLCGDLSASGFARGWKDSGRMTGGDEKNTLNLTGGGSVQDNES